ncbi:bifunctional indole-3-glycerol-phosphate synthase TrpC/phosphoribosylanthranilate isomerase TrpF [Aliidiomarina indica]|uniref:bifunctional indole-3-glycerol-phosphate synthase TrpC/phosphoribosylanthranilate isomerase TrpF n=1 Tax=Aliidiomarina indica TaxID=2749147 RepID=UPI00188F53A4|nr:bifunctional indole-3-glycerol-phosphate synthase TrpC/phosphoribosylanthranilate isomerase TrpF [Aliidiomarina indica]
MTKPEPVLQQENARGLQETLENAPSVLRSICEQRQISLQRLQQHYPEDMVMAAAATHTRPIRDFTAALRQGSAQFIFECKKASPSKGLIRESFDPVAIARIYASYGAAISVLTEPDYFQGDFSYLHAVSQQVTVPVLCKDFIFSRYQVALARYFGADAILLMLSVLDDATYQDLATYAEELGLHILTEVSDADEMARASALAARVIGINHRNLRDLSVDIHRSEKLAPLAPKDAIVIAESGIHHHRDIRQIAPFVNGFLVGSSLTSQEDIDYACRALVYGKHKVCGITSQTQALQARAAGAVYAGMIFAQRSPRRVTIDQAKFIRKVHGLTYVGVVALEDYPTRTPTEIAGALLELVNSASLNAIQVHDLGRIEAQSADAAALFIQALGRALPHQCELWVATAIEDLEQRRATYPDVHRWVVDSGQGGSGVVSNWQQLPTHNREQLILAGGLHPGNAQAAMGTGVGSLDFNSGLELEPGLKCPLKTRAAFHQIREYGRS